MTKRLEDKKLYLNRRMVADSRLGGTRPRAIKLGNNVSVPSDCEAAALARIALVALERKDSRLHGNDEYN